MGTALRVAALSLAVVLVGCTANDAAETSPTAREAAVYEAVLRSLVSEAFAPVAEGDPAPVVFAIGEDGDQIPAETQVEVVKSMKDDVDVRFMDHRDDVIERAVDGEPVKDDGVLVTLGPVPEEGSPVEVNVTLYRSLDEGSDAVFVVQETAGSWAVRSVTTSSV